MTITNKADALRETRLYGNLYNVSNELRNDREVVLTAVSQDGRALEYASAEFKNDRKVVLAAVRH